MLMIPRFENVRKSRGLHFIASYEKYLQADAAMPVTKPRPNFCLSLSRGTGFLLQLSVGYKPKLKP